MKHESIKILSFLDHSSTATFRHDHVIVLKLISQHIVLIVIQKRYRKEFGGHAADRPGFLGVDDVE